MIREYGYDHIVPTFLKNACVTNGGLNHEQKTEMKMKRLLAGQGFYEASTLAFYSVAELDRMHFAADAPERRAIRIMNPISEKLSIMRTVLAPSMLNVIVDNLKKGNAQGRLFELSKVYLPKSLPLTEQPDEHMTLALGAFGPEEDFFTVKGAVEAIAAAFDITFSYQRANVCWLHPGISAEVWCQGKKVGVFGKLANEVTAELKIAKDEKDSQNIYLAELDYAALAEIFPRDYRYKPLSPFAAVKRDLALVCEESITCGDLEQTIRKASSLVSDVALFDVYRGKNLGEGKKSMAFSLTLSDPEKELRHQQDPEGSEIQTGCGNALILRTPCKAPPRCGALPALQEELYARRLHPCAHGAARRRAGRIHPRQPAGLCHRCQRAGYPVCLPALEAQGPPHA